VIEIESYIGYTLASMPQPRNRLENRRSTNDKISRRVWKDIKNRKTKKARITETKNERGKEEEI